MTLKLTSQELSLVRESRKDPKPKYFDSVTGTYLQISDDFESFLILQEKSIKEQAVTWITKCVDIQNIDLTRDFLLSDAIVSESNDSSNILKEVNKLIDEFSEFRSKLSPGKFADISEIQMLISDLQVSIEQLTNMKIRYTHLSTVCSALNRLLTTGGLDDNKIQQTASWSIPLKLY